MSGLFGVISDKNCNEMLFLGTDYHSHMGTQYGGLAVFKDGKIKKKIHELSTSQFKSKFYEDFKKLNGNSGIGVISASNEQPLIFESRFGLFALCITGHIVNKEELSKELIEGGTSFTELSGDSVNITELTAKLICTGNSLLDGITKMFEKIKGSVTLLLLNKDGVYAARDRNGYFPLIIGKGEGTWAVASETCAFSNLRITPEKFLGPGEVVLLTENGMKTIKKNGDVNTICTFLWIYTGFPTSDYEGINAELVRERCGRALAERDNIKADMVAGVPDSGIAHAVGYAMASGLPYRRPLVKYTPGYGRSYTPPSQEIRDKIAFMKLIANKDVISGNRIVICEDSIVRGTQLRNYTAVKLFEGGAKEVHVRPACPPLMFPCCFNISTRSASELVARRAINDLEGKDTEDVTEYTDPDSDKYKKMVDWICKDLKVTSLTYQRLDDMVKAVGLPPDRLCLYCWTGKV